MWWKRKQRNHSGSIKIKNSSGIVWMRKSTLSVIFSTLSVILLVASLTAVGIPVVPMIWYRLNPDTSYALEETLRKPVTDFDEYLRQAGVKNVYQPSRDESLPEENMIMIEKIGVKTEIIEKPVEEYEEAFRQGVWRVPDFGTAYEREYPMILAAHRFGYLAWTNQYRRQNSFFNLPDLEEGDTIEVIWDQRMYTYEVFESEEGEEISNYTADLILYTCKFLESDVRIFRYARLVK